MNIPKNHPKSYPQVTIRNIPMPRPRLPPSASRRRPCDAAAFFRRSTAAGVADPHHLRGSAVAPAVGSHAWCRWRKGEVMPWKNAYWGDHPILVLNCWTILTRLYFSCFTLGILNPKKDAKKSFQDGSSMIVSPELPGVQLVQHLFGGLL